MSSNFLDTFLVGCFPLFLTIAHIQSWFVIVASGVTTIWVIIQIIDKLRKWNQ